MTPRASISASAGRSVRDLLRSSVAPVLLGLVCFLVFNANLRQIGAGDTLPARYIPLILWHEQTLGLDANARLVAHGHPMRVDENRPEATIENVDYFEPPADWIVRTRHNHLASLYPVVTPLLVAPLYLPAVIWLNAHGWEPPNVDYIAEIMEKISASILASLATVVMYLCLRRDSGRWSLPLAVAFAFGTNTWMTSSQALWQHGTAQLLIALALLLALSAKSPMYIAALGAVVVLMAANRPPDALVAGAFVVFVIWSRRRNALWLLAGAAAPAAALLYYNVFFIGHLVGAYALAPSRPRSFFQVGLSGIPGLLVSPSRGLLIFSPFLTIVPLGLMNRLRSQSSRVLAASLGSAVAAQIVLYSQVDWRAGVSWGPRFLTDVLPILVWMLAPAAIALRAFSRDVLISAMAASVAVQAIGAFWYTGTSDEQIFAKGAESFSGAWDVGNTPFVVELRHAPARADLLDKPRGWLDRVGTTDVRRVDQVPELETGTVLEGWALAGTRTPAQVLALIDGVVIGSTGEFLPRADVNAAMHTNSPSGWGIYADTHGVSPGERLLQLAVRSGRRSDVRIIREQRVLVASKPRGLATMADRAAALLRQHQNERGFWLTSFTNDPRYEAPRHEMNTYLTSMLVDLLLPVAQRQGLDDVVQRARRHLQAQIEGNGLVRYHGLPDASTIGTLGCVITPDADDTALVWRIAGRRDDARKQRMLAELRRYRDARGLYRTWLAPRERYQCIDPGRDPNPTDVAIQMHVYLMLRQFDQAAAKELCDALNRARGADDIWTYYSRSALVPYLRSAELERLGCAVPLPTERLARAPAGQGPWSEVARRLVQVVGSPDDANARRAARNVLVRLAGADFAQLKESPPLLYHNDLTATVRRFYWSEDFGYALWLRLYAAAGADAARAREPVR